MEELGGMVFAEGEIDERDDANSILEEEPEEALLTQPTEARDISTQADEGEVVETPLLT